MNATKILWGQVVLVSTVVLAFVWGATEWAVWRLPTPRGGRWHARAREMFWRELEYPQTTGARTLAMKGVLLRSSCSLSAISAGGARSI